MESFNKIILEEIKKYPVLTEKEIDKLLEEYQKKHNQEAKQKLIQHNYGLCLFFAHKYKKIVQNMTLMDLFNENVIILMRAIDGYDRERKVKFSSYVGSAIEKSIKKEINEKEETIRIPENVQVLIGKYNKFCALYYKKYNRNPTDEEIKSELDIKDSQLNNLKEVVKNKKHIFSLDRKVDTEEAQSELVNFIPQEEKAYDQIDNKYDLMILKNKCNELLSREEYYIIYYRYLVDSPFTREKIGKEFGLTGEGIRQKEIKIKNILSTGLKKITENNIHYYEELDPLPISYIIVLNELKSKLTKEEYYLLYSIVRNKNDNPYCNLLGLNPSQLKETKLYVMNIFSQYNKEEILEKLILAYRKRYTISQILNLDIKINYKDLINFQKLDDYFKRLNLGDIQNMEYYQRLSLPKRKLIDRYFCKNKEILKFYQKDQIERELTLNQLGYIKKGKKLFSPNQLREFYKDYEFLLTDKQQEDLKMILFTKDGQSFFPKCNVESLINCLIRKKFQIDSYFGNQLTSFQLQEVVTQYPNLLDSREQDLMFQYYGVNQKKVSLEYLSKKYHTTYKKLNSETFNLRIKVLKKNYHIVDDTREDFIDENKNLYKHYINCSQYDFTEDARKALSMYLDGKKYKEIVKEMNNLREKKINESTIKNVIFNAFFRCELYQYGVSIPELISEEDIETVANQNHYSDLEKKILKERFLNLTSIKEIENKYQISQAKINYINKEFYEQYLYLKCPSISIEDYIEEVNKHPSESVLSEKDKQLLALKYGIKSRYNLSGEALSQKELNSILALSNNYASKKQQSIDDKIRRRKIGFLRPKYGIIPREELEKIFSDKNLPINEKEKDIIGSLNEIAGYSYQTEKELSKKYQESTRKIKVAYDKAILTIKKYQDGKKVSNQYDYEKDIKKVEKYFSEYDRRLLKMYYKEKYSIESISKKLGISFNQAYWKIMRLKMNVLEILKDEIVATKFDFDYAREVIKKTDLPLYYYNNDLIIKIYQMLSGEAGNKKYTAQEIKEKLHLETNESYIHESFYDVLMAVEKYKRGIRKENGINNTQVLDYYQKKGENISKNMKRKCERFMEIQKQLDTNLMKSENLSLKFIYEIIKDEGHVQIENLSHEDAIKILANRNLILTSNCRKNIKNYFQIAERDLMSGKDKMKALKLLSPMYQKVSTNKKLQKK